MNHNTRITAALLAALTLAGLASCGGDATAQAPIDTNPIDDTVTETAAENAYTYAEIDCGGEEFHILKDELAESCVVFTDTCGKDQNVKSVHFGYVRADNLLYVMN